MNLSLLVYSIMFMATRKTLIARKTTPAPIPSLCPELSPECYCSTYSFLLNVDCQNLATMENVSNTLRSSFTNVTINHILMKNSSLPGIEANTFTNLSIRKIIYQQGTLGNVSDDAFDGIDDLSTLSLERIPDFESIPNAMISLNLTVLILARSNLTAIGTQIQNMTTLMHLDFSFNQIAFVHPEAFMNCISLRQMDMSHNLIQQLDPFIFKNVHNMIELRLANNWLYSIRGVLNFTAWAIQNIHLENNSFSSLSDIISVPVRSLQELYLDNNPLCFLKSEDVSGKFLDLTVLSLTNTSLQWIGENAFRDMTKLVNLDLNHNMLTYLPRTLFPLSLIELYLDHNQLTNVTDTFKDLPSLSTLSLKSNRITDIGGMFEMLPNLKKLIIDYNEIEAIPNECFVKVPSLHRLSLGYNKIRELNNGSFIGLNRGLIYLDLSDNQIKNFGGAFGNKNILPRLQTLLLRKNLLRHISWNDFMLVDVKEIDLQKNNLSHLDSAFVETKNLRILNLGGNQLETIVRGNLPDKITLNQLNLKDNPMVCDCRLLWLVKSSNHHVIVDRLSKCVAPQWLAGFYLHRLNRWRLLQWKDDCPEKCACLCYPRHGEVTITVHCQRLNLTSVPKVYPSLTVNLNVSDNALQSLPRNLSHYVPGLEVLDLSGNHLNSLDEVDFPLSLQSLNLSNNIFERFPIDIVNTLDLTHIRLSENPWLCDCNADSFRSWLLKNFDKVDDINGTLCSNAVVNGGLKGKRLSGLSQLDLCPIRIALYASVAIAALAVLLSVSGTFIGYIRYKMPVKVWLYNKGLFLRWVKEKDLDEDKEFDAFVAFSTEEQNCVDQLLKELETKPPFFKICIHYRNFIGGALILDNIARAVKSSKKTLVLLSESFLKSEWAMTEFRQAHHQMLEEKINRIIMVLVGELPSNEDIDEDVKAYLKTATYLSWEDKYFWEKLRYAMPKNAVPSSCPTDATWDDDDTSHLVK